MYPLTAISPPNTDYNFVNRTVHSLVCRVLAAYWKLYFCNRFILMQRQEKETSVRNNPQAGARDDWRPGFEDHSFAEDSPGDPLRIQQLLQPWHLLPSVRKEPHRVSREVSRRLFAPVVRHKTIIILEPVFVYIVFILIRQGRPGCPKIARGISDEDKRVILRLHDEYRAEVARGEANARGLSLPPAAAMAQMVRKYYRQSP